MRASYNKLFWVVVVGGAALACGGVVAPGPPAPDPDDADAAGSRADAGKDTGATLGFDAGAADADGGDADEDVQIPHITK